MQGPKTAISADQIDSFPEIFYSSTISGDFRVTYHPRYSPSLTGHIIIPDRAVPVVAHGP